MAGTTIKSDFPYNPSYAYAPLIYKRKRWADDWEPAPELQLRRCSLATAGQGLSEIALERSYGSISQIGETTYSTVEAADLAGWWVRLDLVGPEGLATQWGGKLFGEPREIEGADLTDDSGNPIRSGEQVWIGYGPQALLDRYWIHNSYWDGAEVGGSGSGKLTIGWLPGINARDDRGLLLGNRSADISMEGCYLYGNKADWTHYQYIKYLLVQYLDESDRLDAEGAPDPGPAWRLGGQPWLLDGLTGVVPLDPVESIGAILRRLIRAEHGVDYYVRYVHTDDGEGFEGFELVLYGLLATSVSFAGQTLPGNLDSVIYTAVSGHAEPRCIVERRKDDWYNVIRILGRRAVVCCSLGGSAASIAEIAGTLEGKWSSDLQIEYEEGAGDEYTYTPEHHDLARAADRYDAVFQVFGAPAAWDQFLHRTLYASKHDGTFDESRVTPGPWVVSPPYQNAIRATLDWTPLKRNVDYSVDPAVDCTPAGHTSDLLPPCVWLCRERGEYYAHGWERADAHGVGVSALRHDWGVKLSSTPNHLVAADTFEAREPTRVAPLYLDSRMVVTIAFEADSRPVAEIVVDEVDGQPDRPSDGVLEIYDDAIETWLLAPYTVVGVDEQLQLVHSGDEPRILREDAARLHLVMAGAIARHQRDRARAEIHAVGLVPWAALLGKMLSAVEEGGDSQDVSSPLTSIEWTMDREGTATTIIRTGFASN